MAPEMRRDVETALAKAAPCPKCGGDEFLVTNSSYSEHDPGCDGSCRNCPVEVPDQDVGPCDCVMQQANVTEAEYQHAVGWLRTLLAENAEHEAAVTEMNRLAAELACTKLDVAGCGYTGADLEQAVRFGWVQGNTYPTMGWSLDDAVAAWRERRAAEKGTR